MRSSVSVHVYSTTPALNAFIFCCNWPLAYQFLRAYAYYDASMFSGMHFKDMLHGMIDAKTYKTLVLLFLFFDAASLSIHLAIGFLHT
jgi:hypothetical protein